ncbi:MAG: hypothetical protein JJU02_11170 [Cryomorphaceae bacterium]|nr:hypothetical protein [Cryomorphaceae bacterium]
MEDKNKAIENLCTAEGLEVMHLGNLAEKFTCLCCVQAFNERGHVADFQKNISPFVDGFVLLDDGSTDGTSEVFDSTNMIVHLRRKTNSDFDDLSNRNVLFKIGEILNVHWLLFLDMDERLDAFYIKPFHRLLQTSKADLIRVRYVHAWNHPDQYRADYPYSNNGVQNRLKLIRKKSKMQIQCEKKLHFELIPYPNGLEDSSEVLVIHLGSLDPKIRKRRYDNYKKLDPKGAFQSSYDHLLDSDVPTKNIIDLRINEIGEKTGRGIKSILSRLQNLFR